MIPTDLSLADVPGLPVKTSRLLAKEGVNTVADVIWHLPFRHEDRRHMKALAFQAGPLPSCHHVLVTKTGNKFFGGRSGMFEAVVQHAGALLGQQLTLKWWNMPFMSRVLAEGQELIVYGIIKDTKGRLSMAHPEYEIVKGGQDEDAEQIHTGRITPVYRLKGSMTQKALRVAAWHVFQALAAESFAEDLLPTPSAEGEFAGMTRSLALREAHFPSSMEKLEQARRYLALEEFYGYQLRVARRKRRVIQSGGRAQKGTGELLRDFLAELPFQLTAAQQRCLEEIQRDMASGAPMNRLLHGDVGSGKTVVAFAAMLRAVESGRQAVLMAPTQILAEQHARNARKWLEPLGLRVALRTGTKREDGDGMELLGRSARVPRAVSRVSRETDPAPSTETCYSRRRLPHFERPWAKYFVSFSTAARRPLPESARQIVLDAIRHFDANRYHLYAACVMPDHVHMLIEPTVAEKEAGTDAPIFHTLTDILRSLKSFTAHEIVKAGWPDQRVWEKESFDRMMRSEADLQEKFEYIAANPSEAGLVKAGEDYPWLWTSGDGAPRDAEHSTRDACAPVRSSGPEIVIGTHALLHDAELMHNTGIVVIDEQHKFGVAQRAKLIRRGDTPDVLVMTATPIPRTLTLTIYGDLDVSTIDQRPRDGVKIITKVRPQSKQKDAAKFLREQIEEGRQGYVVYPLIDESEKLDAGAATKGHEEWSKMLAPCEVGLLHGRLSSEEKEDVMKRFRAGKLDALVSTTVIEVGIDVPNATVMFIHDAGRFGLAQLHQLRGRIGRGAHTSYCVLFVDAKDEENRQRLAIMEETSDGFQIAEEDLRRRGPGDVLGHAQSGQAPLRFGELLADTRLVRLARQLAERTLDEDPHLLRPALAAFRDEPVVAEKAQAMMQ